MPVRPPKPAVVVPLYPAYVVDQDGRKWGYINHDGKFVIPPSFQYAEAFGPAGLAVVRQNGRNGLVNAAGTLVAQPTFDSIATDPAGGPAIAANYGSPAGYQVLGPIGKVLFSTDGYVGGFSEGLAPFSRTVGATKLYGYIDETGTVVIEPQYAGAEHFQDGKALVRLSGGGFALIDATGKQLTQFDHQNVTNWSEGAAAFLDKASKMWGYVSETGEVLIPARFSFAGAFTGGLAVVTVADSPGEARVGLINRKGEFVIPAEYPSVASIGAGLLAVGEPGHDYVPMQYLRKAIFRQDGTRLTDFLFYDVGKAERGVISVTDAKSTFFIDLTGAKVGSLPTMAGIGTMRFADDLIRADIDGDASYLTGNGRAVWQADPAVKLPGGVQVNEVKYRPDLSLLIRYPVLSGLPDAGVQESINRQLKQIFLGDQPPQGDMANGTVKSVGTSGYTAKALTNLLIIHETGSTYPVGAAHGMPSSQYYHFDLKTGARYSLADLFKRDSLYTERLAKLVAEQIAQNHIRLNNLNPPVGANHLFAIQADGLKIYYYPYEIAPYAAGFPEFLIPWGDIIDLIDTDGAFWKSFH